MYKCMKRVALSLNSYSSFPLPLLRKSYCHDCFDFLLFPPPSPLTIFLSLPLMLSCSHALMLSMQCKQLAAGLALINVRAKMLWDDFQNLHAFELLDLITLPEISSFEDIDRLIEVCEEGGPCKCLGARVQRFWFIYEGGRKDVFYYQDESIETPFSFSLFNRAGSL